ncbi:MAG: porin [Rhodovulum sulfidophilum]|uniref:Porin n=1 Tax=Rhodovulum sulfidophilum TaxID=35806 RepID=A0A2W5NBP8_RHOSU|nr:MAG: porin [Rhodovulum sulfidophilum]
MSAFRVAFTLLGLLGLPTGGFAQTAGSGPAGPGCATRGEGFVTLAGTGTCVDPGGYLWAEGYYNSYTDYPSGDDRTYGIATLGLTLDTATPTSAGPLLGFVDVRLRYRGADAWSDGPAKAEIAPWNVYLEFGGFTGGYRQSMFDFYSNANVAGTDPYTIGDGEQISLLAYTRDFAGGWRATLSAEDASARGGGVIAADAGATARFGQDSDIPDIVATVARTRDRGDFQVSGALHRIRAATPSRGYAGASDPETWGYALQAGAMVKLPRLAAGDSLYLQTAFVDGAVSYLGLVDASGDFSPPDAYITAEGGLSKVSGWNVTAQFLHDWAPAWQSAFFGGFARFDIDDAAARTSQGASGGDNFNLGANLTWTPEAPLSFVAQYAYNRYAARDYTDTGNGLPEASQEAHQLLLMVEYTF